MPVLQQFHNTTHIFTACTMYSLPNMLCLERTHSISVRQRDDALNSIEVWIEFNRVIMTCSYHRIVHIDLTFYILSKSIP